MRVFRRMLGIIVGVLLALCCTNAWAEQDNYFTIRSDLSTSAYLPELPDTGTSTPYSYGEVDQYGSSYAISLLLSKETEVVLNGKYERFSGTIFIPYENMSKQGSCVVRIYADDQLVYESATVDSKAKSQPFDVSVAGADFLKITKTDIDLPFNYWTTPHIGDPIVYQADTPPNDPSPGEQTRRTQGFHS